MSGSRLIPWKRIGVEAAAIVASILLAFAIDAWWDGRIEHGRTSDQLRSLAIEFGEVQSHLRIYEAQLLNLRQAVSNLLSHIGPETELQTVDTIYALIDLSFRASKMELPTASLQSLLASGGNVRTF